MKFIEALEKVIIEDSVVRRKDWTSEKWVYFEPQIKDFIIYLGGDIKPLELQDVIYYVKENKEWELL